MAAKPSFLQRFRWMRCGWRHLAAAVLAAVLAWGGAVHAANNSVQGAKKDDNAFDGDAPTAILIEATSGSILFEKNADELRAPSSMMKLMTVEVIFNAIKEGKIKLTDEFRISENAWRRGGAPSGGSTMFAAIHSKVPVDDLLHGAIIQSGNDSCIALAEGMAGSERKFANDFMTKRARALGLTRSTFGNASGLPDPDNKMTVRELAMLARHIILDFPEFYPLFNEREFTWNKIRQYNRNPLLNMSIGADGMKTGFTKEAGYGIVGTATQDGKRLIVVVNGLENGNDRRDEAKKLLEWGFRSFAAFKLFKPDEVVGSARVWGGDRFYVPLVGRDGVAVLLPRYPANQRLTAEIIYQGPLKPPIKRGDQVARLRVTSSSSASNEVPLFAAEDVEKAGIMRQGLDSLVHLAFDWIKLKM